MGRLRVSFAVAVILVTVGVVTFMSAAAAARRDGNGVTALPGLNASILARVNAVRASRGLSRLRLAPGLAAAARLHSRQMALSGLFRHESPDGAPFRQRIRRFYGNAGFRSWSVGETLEWQSSPATATGVVAAWLAGPPHRRLLLDPSWQEIGVGAVEDTAAPGDFGGLDATIVTADFGARARY